ncbi:MAG TPA: hypothetical protein VHK01_05865 [Lacipirellulaceae bacterium]|nr:hypothetical protein [Lacipirellulaceae bacterium]
MTRINWTRGQSMDQSSASQQEKTIDVIFSQLGEPLWPKIVLK